LGGRLPKRINKSLLVKVRLDNHNRKEKGTIKENPSTEQGKEFRGRVKKDYEEGRLQETIRGTLPEK